MKKSISSTKPGRLPPDHFMGIGSTWKQFGTPQEILADAVDLLGRGGDIPMLSVISHGCVSKCTGSG